MGLPGTRELMILWHLGPGSNLENSTYLYKIFVSYLYPQIGWESLPCYLLGLIILTLVSLDQLFGNQFTDFTVYCRDQAIAVELILSQSNQQSPITGLFRFSLVYNK